jgi:hypothetical protein
VALTGAEHRGCWAPARAADAPAPPPPEPLRPIPNEVLRLRPDSRPPFLPGFVAVELANRAPGVLPPDVPDPAPSPPPTADIGISWADRDSLFGD